MALITRFTRLFQADIHAVLDRIEEPDVLLGHAIREMEEDITRDEQRAGALKSERAQTGNRRSEIERAVQELQEELEVCFRSGEEDLARAVIRRKLQADQLNRTLAQKDKSLTDSLAELDNRLSENRERLSVMRQKSELLSGDQAPVHSGPPWASGPALITDQEVEVAFLREKQRRNVS